MRSDWRSGYHQQAERFPDLHDKLRGLDDGESEADYDWSFGHLSRSDVPRLELSLADLIESAPVRRQRGGKKKGAGKRAVEADDGFSVLGSEAGTEMWSEMGEEELASVLAALDEEADEWELCVEVPTATPAVVSEAE